MRVASGCACALLLLGAAGRAQVPAGSGEVRTIIRGAAEGAAREHGILAAPGVIEQMTASAVIFVGNFCYPHDSEQGRSRCRRTAGDPAVMQGIVGEFLVDAAVNRPATIESVGAKMARAVQMDFAMAGWPSRSDNALAVLDISSATRGATIELRTAGGPVALGTAGRAVVIGAGRWELVARSGEQRASATVQAQGRAQTVVRLEPSGGPAVAPVVGSVEATPDFFCYSPLSTAAAPGLLGAFNWGRSIFVESEQVRAANLAPFASQVALDIRVEDESGACGRDCLEGLGIAFAHAVAIWRSGCARCDPNSLSVVRLRQTVWVDARIARRLRKIATGVPVALDLRTRVAGEIEATLAPPAVGAPQTTIVAYEEIGADPQVTATLCALDGGLAPWLPDAQHLVCNRPAPAPSAGATPVFRLRSTATSCGRAEDFIACGLPNERVEVALGEYRYEIRTPRGRIFLGRDGGAPIDVRMVVLHEVGHWFGLPHAEIAGPHATLDVMSEVLGDGKACVSAQSMIMMNNASDLRWPHRITAGGGLRKSRPAGSSR